MFPVTYLNCLHPHLMWIPTSALPCFLEAEFTFYDKKIERINLRQLAAINEEIRLEAEAALKRNPDDYNAQLNIIYLKADKAKVTEIIPYIRKMTNISPKILKSIQDSHLDEEKEMEAIWEVGGVFQITAVTFKNSGDANTRKMANDAYAQRVNKEWYLRILELTKLFFTFGDDLESVFDGKYNDLAVNSYKTGIWYYLDIIKLSEDQEVHIKKIRNYEEKIRLVEPDFESRLDLKVGKNKESFFGRLLSRN